METSMAEHRRARPGQPRRMWRWLVRSALPVLICCAPASAQVGGLDGWLDERWDDDGRLVFDLSPVHDRVSRLLIQPDGKLLLVGNCGGHLCAARLRANGSFDSQFGPGGSGRMVYENLPTVTKVADALLLPNGSFLVLARTTEPRVMVVRIAGNGAVDTSAGAGQGYLAFHYLPAIDGPGSDAEALALLADGRILVAGGAQTRRHGAMANYDIAIARLSADLSGLDPSFGDPGDSLSPPGIKIVTLDMVGAGDPNNNNDQAYAIVVLPDGRLQVAGTSQAPAPATLRSVLLRFQADGPLDQTFADGGRLVFHYPGAAMTVLNRIRVDRRGRIVMAGRVATSATQGTDFLIARRLANGQPDHDFGEAGFSRVNFDIGAPHQDAAEALALQGDGRILAAGWAYESGARIRFALTRVGDNGVVDPTLGMAGRNSDTFVPTPPVAHLSQITGMVPGNGGLMVVGYTEGGGQTGRFAIARLTLDLIHADGFQPP